MTPPDEATIVAVLRTAGARFAFVFGSRATGTETPASDVDVAAWWGGEHPAPWELDLPEHTDLVVLDDAPWWLAGRVAMRGRLLFDDDPAARVRWQAETRLRYLDDLPLLLESQQTWRRAVADGR